MQITRRRILTSIGLGAVMPGGLVPLFAPKARAASSSRQVPAPEQWRHGLSQFGELKYLADFSSFDYVNPAAPKAGRVRQGALATFDNFNMIPEGAKGNLATGMELIHDTVLVPALDEPSTQYGLLAEAVACPRDFSSLHLRLRTDARWHDGRPLTPDDVVFSFEALRRHNPRLQTHYRHVSKIELAGEREIIFTFDAPNRELPGFIGRLTVLPKHWWEGKDASGNPRDVSATTLEPPLGSGPYRIKAFEPGRFIIYERVRDYWGNNVNVRRGCNNFDEVRFDFFRDLSTAFEAFKADALDWHVEFSAKSWATGYDFRACNDGRVVREEFPIRNRGIMQAFAFNTRRTKFKNPLARRAFNFAFDFESINSEIFYGQYKRVSSYFEGTELACSGLPQGRELEMLETVRGNVPPEVFATPYWNPVAGDARSARKNLLEAMALFNRAGFIVRDMRLIDPDTGEQLQVEFLLNHPGYEPATLSYKASLQRLGIGVTVRLVDPVQHANRLRQWDFDVVVATWPERLSPGFEERHYWGSHAAHEAGSQNLIGIENPAVDALIDQLVSARDRAELVAATRALDRVLLWNHYVVPQWNYNNLRTARWDRFSHAQTMPRYGVAAFPDCWWWDARRAARTA